MPKLNRGSILIGLIAVATVLLSLQAIVYYVRWFIPYLNSHRSYLIPPGKTGAVWFMVKIISNTIFLTVGILLFKLFWRFRASGYFGKESLRVLDFFVLSCLGLAILWAVRQFVEKALTVKKENESFI